MPVSTSFLYPTFAICFLYALRNVLKEKEAKKNYLEKNSKLVNSSHQILGDENAKYIITEFFDYRCGYCVKARKLIDVTYEAMMRGIEKAKPGNTTGDIGFAIQSYAESKNYSIVRDFCGHGLGRVFHDQPSILHFGNPGEGDVLKEGMFFTIEPMINVGGYSVRVLDDGWTAVTSDKSLSAQFEHTVGITKSGCEIFTLSPKNLHYPPYK